eukprot:CAMPEP_0175830984 /NCGR_PEP_ID=MMETSP0107_2-20121207/14218_1 /TAXON_ID=195067 ORGANISM="Goniomonas pacifica, Strain CCMP1869" /NCGR_SAMPLE_ID=MMETSP0107_2 /ASSEMBLY_ACC=CAM_ASM_000203 /LENGTH=141 /DNA_ID=CAMNT_0017143983 /DNA_START=273 /DNA_END=698 /DNA_ORIENTATION=-
MALRSDDRSEARPVTSLPPGGWLATGRWVEGGRRNEAGAGASGRGCRAEGATGSGGATGSEGATCPSEGRLRHGSLLVQEDRVGDEATGGPEHLGVVVLQRGAGVAAHALGGDAALDDGVDAPLSVAEPSQALQTVLPDTV